MRYQNLICSILYLSCLFGETSADLSSRIIIDGYSNDFSFDEEVVNEIHESSSDSYWGEYNDVKGIKVTWDNTFLYLAVDACSWDNNVMLFIDVYDHYGIEDMSEVNAWQRSFKFYNINPDYFVGTWDTNDSPQFWKVQEGGALQLEWIQNIETFSTFNTGSINRSMEMKIPWTDLQVNQEPIRSIKLLSLITSGDDFSGSPDCAPDNLGGMSNNSSQMVVLDNYVNILIDADSNGEPDLGILPQERTTFYKTPPFSPLPLLVENVLFENGKVFSPSSGEKVYFELETNRGSEFDVKIFDLNGEFVDFSDDEIQTLSWSWDGRNQRGEIVPFGVYILYFIANSGEISQKETVVVVH